MEPWYRRRLWALALMAALALGIVLISVAVLRYRLPFSWDVWYHIRMGESFTHGYVWWDWGSFGPTGRPNLYPPAFHLLLAGLSAVSSSSVQSVARALPLVFYPVTLALVFWLCALLYDRRTALLSVVFCSLIPVFVDRGVIPSSQALASIFMLLALIFFAKSESDRRYAVASGAFGAGVVLGHGLTLIVLACVILVMAAAEAWESRETPAALRLVFVRLGIFAGVAALLPSYWLYYLFDHGVYSRIPESAAMALRDYPSKLGELQLGLACAGVAIVLARRTRADRVLVGWFAATFLLSTAAFWVLPSRFVEFMAIPCAMLAAVAVNRMLLSEHRLVSLGLIGIVLVALAGPYAYVNSISPLVYEHEEAALLWLRDDAVVSGQVITGWFFAPVTGAISGKVPIKGSYYSGSFHYTERTNDTNSFYRGDLSIAEKYDISYVFYGRKESYDYGQLSFLDASDSASVMYSGASTQFYHLTEG
jgi:4-amino-4-deoxy-L-arabinose transferase-like glycosyltransferase